MAARQSFRGEDSCSRWHEALELGKKLFSLTRLPPGRTLLPEEVLKNFCRVVIQSTEEFLHCQAALSLDPLYFSNFIGKTGLETEHKSLDSKLAEQVNQNKNALCGGMNDQQETWIAADINSFEPAKIIVIPLRVAGGETLAEEMRIGNLQLGREQGNPFDREQIQQAIILVGQVSLGLQSISQLAVESWRQEQLSLVQKVSAQIADVHDLDKLFKQVTSLIQETFDYYYVAVLTLEENQEYLHLRASNGLNQTDFPSPADGSGATSFVVHLGQGLVGSAAESGQEILANNVCEDKRYREVDLLPETRAEVVIPLKIDQKILGVLDVQSDQEDYFDQTDMTVLRTLAGNIAVAIEGARLYESLRRRANQLSVIHEVSNAITSILDTENLFDEVVSLIVKRFGYSMVHIFSVHPGRRRVFFEAGNSPLSSSLREAGFSYDLDDPQGMIPWVARHGDILLVNDVAQEPRYRQSMFAPSQTQAELTVPLIFGGEILGVLDVQVDRVDAFGEEDRFIFEALADHIAIAMRNATLYRSEIWRREVADGLREVAGLLSADVDVDRVLAAILDELENTLPLEVAAIWFTDEEEHQDSSDHHALYLAALQGKHAAQLGFEPGVSLDNLVSSIFTEQDEHSEKRVNAGIVEALTTGKAIIRSPQAPYELLGATLNYPLDYSAITTPLRVGDQNLGVLVLAHHTSGRYGSEARAMTEAFASYAAVAIENARLYESAHEQAWISTVLLQVAEATQSQTNLNDLLNTVIHITPMLAGMRACLIYIMDEDGVFMPAAASGLDPEQEKRFESWRFTSGDVPALDRLIEERQPILVGLQGEDCRLTSFFLSPENEDLRRDTDLFILVPMLSHSEILGAFLVDYSLKGAGNSGERALASLFDERLAIIQGIAYQTATAVENIRLTKSQKEEAYVSVALLQVAQAIVSANDLDEALGSIVRITPILVGVKRSVIFLWDENHKVFRVSQAYGIARELEDRIYPTYEFPLLDSARQRNSLLAYPIDETISTSEDVLDAWSFLTPPDEVEVDIYLEEEPCLIFAFPLGVKGRVLGVLLVEEPYPVQVDVLPRENGNRRLREKRLEIITGISQQVAMAIENDILQRETVIQERMAREMQLAREIQQAFLPHNVPEINGWDFKVFWKTAREVGGDFYDFFELPDARIGLVIADVADKGMPAALFMTLARTLVRATALQLSAPEQVLERVNELLVPDAPKGMFVTLVYAVLDFDTGQLEYANAGHNPPLWLHYQAGDLEPFDRTGMALGVLDKNKIEGRKILLEPDDLVIMYTDGVTEAFSPQGEIFGEQRLMQKIRTVVKPDTGSGADAQTVLEAIDRAVSEFAGDLSPADDLTLLILKRLPL